MPYVTSVERIGIKQGLHNAGREILFEVVGRHFGVLPEDVTREINEIDSYDRLKFLVIQAMTCETVDDLRKFLKQPEPFKRRLGAGKGMEIDEGMPPGSCRTWLMRKQRHE